MWLRSYSADLISISGLGPHEGIHCYHSNRPVQIGTGTRRVTLFTPEHEQRLQSLLPYYRRRIYESLTVSFPDITENVSSAPLTSCTRHHQLSCNKTFDEEILRHMHQYQMKHYPQVHWQRTYSKLFYGQPRHCG